jgi:hypothetical protein
MSRNFSSNQLHQYREIPKPISDEAYELAKKWVSEDLSQEELYKLHAAYHIEFFKEETAAQLEHTTAIGKLQQEISKLNCENAQLETAKINAEQEALIIQQLFEQERIVRIEATVQAKVEMKLSRKAQKEKRFQLKAQLLKAQKEKQEQLLSIGKKLLETGQDVNTICLLLGISEVDLRAYINKV